MTVGLSDCLQFCVELQAVASVCVTELQAVTSVCVTELQAVTSVCH